VSQSFAEHTVAALNLVEDIMAKRVRRTTPVRFEDHMMRLEDAPLQDARGRWADFVPVWCEEESGAGPLCRECANDARRGGARLRMGHVTPGAGPCQFCHQVIEGDR